MSMSIPESISERAQLLAARNGYSQVADYLEALFDREEREPSPFAGREAEVEAACLEALDEPAAPMTPEDWEDIRTAIRTAARSSTAV